MTEKNSGPEEAIKGVVEGAKGKAKEVIGAVAGRDDLYREGQAQQDKADAQRNAAQKEAEAEAARADAKRAMSGSLRLFVFHAKSFQLGYEQSQSRGGVRDGVVLRAPVASNAAARRSSATSSWARPAIVSPTGMPVSSIVPIGTVTVGMPRWRIAKFPLATQTPLRQPRFADDSLTSMSAGPTSATAGKKTASRLSASIHCSRSTRRISSSPHTPSSRCGMSRNDSIG